MIELLGLNQGHPHSIQVQLDITRPRGVKIENLSTPSYLSNVNSGHLPSMIYVNATLSDKTRSKVVQGTIFVLLTNRPKPVRLALVQGRFPINFATKRM